MTDKSDDKVGHLNTILARGGGNLNDPIFKSSNARGLPGGGMLKFRVDRRIILCSNFIFLSFLGMVMYDNEFETMENKIRTKDKIEPQHV